jgi:hypothetical protein
MPRHAALDARAPSCDCGDWAATFQSPNARARTMTVNLNFGQASSPHRTERLSRLASLAPNTCRTERYHECQSPQYGKDVDGASATGLICAIRNDLAPNTCNDGRFWYRTLVARRAGNEHLSRGERKRERTLGSRSRVPTPGLDSRDTHARVGALETSISRGVFALQGTEG